MVCTVITFGVPLVQIELNNGATKLGKVEIVKLDALELVDVTVPVTWPGSSSTLSVVNESEGGAHKATVVELLSEPAATLTCTS